MTRRSRRAILKVIIVALALMPAACADSGSDEVPAGEADTTEEPQAESEQSEEEGTPEELTQVEFLLNFSAYPADHAYYALGIQEGIFEQHGIAVSLVEGTGSGDALAALGVGRYPLALLDTGTLMLGIANEDVPVTNIGVINQRSPMSLIFMSEKGFETVEDVRGLTIASSQGGSMTRLFPGLLAANGMTEEDINMALVGSGESQQVAMLSGQADAFLGYYPDDGMTLRLEGHDVDWISFADSGVNLLNLGIGANVEWLEDNQEIAQAFMRAIQEAVEATLAAPQDAAQAFVDQYPEAGYTVEMAAEMLEVSFELLSTETSAELPVGMAAEEDWRQSEDLLEEYMELQPAEGLDQYYTDEFVQ